MNEESGRLQKISKDVKKMSKVVKKTLKVVKYISKVVKDIKQVKKMTTQHKKRLKTLEKMLIPHFFGTILDFKKKNSSCQRLSQLAWNNMEREKKLSTSLLLHNVTQ